MNSSAVSGDTRGFVSSRNWRPSASSLGLNNEITAADWWFAALDQRLVPVNNMNRTIRVLGVHLDADHAWIQIELAEDGSCLLLHLTPLAGLQDAVNMVRARITGDDEL